MLCRMDTGSWLLYWRRIGKWILAPHIRNIGTRLGEKVASRLGGKSPRHTLNKMPLGTCSPLDPLDYVSCIWRELNHGSSVAQTVALSLYWLSYSTSNHCAWRLKCLYFKSLIPFCLSQCLPQIETLPTLWICIDKAEFSCGFLCTPPTGHRHISLCSSD